MIHPLLAATLLTLAVLSPAQSVVFEEQDGRLIFEANWVQQTSDIAPYIDAYKQALESKRIRDLRLSFTYCKDPEYILKHLFAQNLDLYRLSINLDTCKVGDKGIAHILDKIDQHGLSQLHLILSSTGATHKLGRLLGQKIEDLEQLKALKLGLMMIKLGDQGLSHLLQHPLGHNVEDFSLDLTNCKLGLNAFQNFTSFMSRLSGERVTRVEIIVRGNKLEPNSTMDIAKNLKRFTNLESFKFDAYFNNLKSQGVKPLSLLIKRLSKLRVLSLNFDLNYIQNEGGKYIGEAIRDLSLLSYLQIGVSTKNFGYNGYSHILNGMMNLPQLKYLSFRCGVNRIGSKAAHDFAKLFGKLTNLEYLDLHLVENLMYDQGLTVLADSINRLGKLQTLKLNFGFNEVRKSGITHALKMIENKNLRNIWFGMSNNPIEDAQISEAFPHIQRILNNCTAFQLELLYTKVSQKKATALKEMFEKAKGEGRCSAILHINSQEEVRRAKEEIQRQDEMDRRGQQL